MVVEWNINMSVGVKEIDDQHKTFVGIMNDLYNHFNKGDLQMNAIMDIVKQLENYSKFHFATEEKYFDMFDYEGAEEHKKVHQDLLRRFMEIKGLIEKEGSEKITDLIDFLEDWLVNHLEIYDKKYTKCFHEHGLY